jgi:uncharacterized protein (TIGR02145 family)
MNLVHKYRITTLLLLVFGLFLLPFLNSCKKETTDAPALQTNSVTDIDGNVYKTVKIGNQWWMAENLKVKRYRSGDSITFVDSIGLYSRKFDSTTWVNSKSGAYCKGYYGFFYNGFIKFDSIAPAGWHIPTDDEWKTMEMHLGMSKEEADKVNWRGNKEGNMLKFQAENSGAYWLNSADNYEIWGSNESGFTAKGGSCMMFYGTSEPVSNTGFWWTSTKYDNQEVWYRYLDYNKANVFRYHGSKNYGLSIRCVKD